MVSRYNLSNGNGGGSRDEISDMYDSEEYQSKDQRGPNATTYYASDVKQHVGDERTRKSLLNALRWQEGEDAPAGVDDLDRGTQNHNEYKRRMTNGLCSQLDMTPHQKRRCQHIRESVTVQKFGPYRIEEAILGIILEVADEDHAEGNTRMVDRDMFEEIVESCDTTMKRARRAQEILIDKMEDLDDEVVVRRGR